MPGSVEKRVEFVVDGLRLVGCLHLPERPPQAVIVGVHGLMADKDSPKQIALAGQLTSRQMAFFRFDHRGCGESDGVFDEQTTLENRCSDLIAAITAATGVAGSHLPIGLFGSSLGGTVCLAVARRAAPFAMVTLAAPVRNRSIRLPADSPESLRTEITANRLTFNIAAQIESIHHLLVIHGGADETVPVDNAHEIYRLAAPPKRLIILDDGDHRVSDRSHQDRFVEATTAWFIDCHRSQFG